jgi:hypothetical protein
MVAVSAIAPLTDLVSQLHKILYSMQPKLGGTPNPLIEIQK